MIWLKAQRRVSTALTDYDKIVLWGAGSSGRQALFLLPRDKVAYIVDSFAVAETAYGLPVRRPEALKAESGKILVVIASVAGEEIREWLHREQFSGEATTAPELLARTVDDNDEMGKLLVDCLIAYEGGWLETLLQRPQLVVNVSYRLCRRLGARAGLFARMLLFVARLWHTFNCAFFGIHVPPSVSAGVGLQFAHYGGIVLHKNLRLGRFVSIYQCVTVGADKRGEIPRIGNHVTLWSSAVLIGDCHIGNHVQVGANSLCLGKLVAENALVAGNPARVMRQFG